MENKYLVKINGYEVTSFIEIDSYSTSLIPVCGESVTTMDGVEHVSVIRNRGEVSFAVNPMTDTQTRALSEVLSKGVVEVEYHCLQRNTLIIATMRLDGVTAQFLGRVRYGGRKWNELQSIKLTEL